MHKFVDIPDIEPAINLMLCGYVTLDGWTCADRAAPYWRIYWNSTRGAHVTFDGKKYILKPDIVVAIPPNTPFASHGDHPARQFFVHFTMSSNLAVAAPDIYRCPVDDHLRSLVKRLTHGFEAEWHGRLRYYLMVHELIFALLARIRHDRWKRVTSDSRIMKVLRAIENASGSPISNEELAHTACMSTNGFIRLFHSELGTSPQRYQMVMRMETASMELLYTDDSIDDIAERHGFCDRSHFAKAFKKFKRINPARYRKRAVYGE